jgi:predicted negative regulator of RcsB-dependent stress response
VKQILPLVVEVVVVEAMMAMEKRQSNSADCEHDDANLVVSGTGDIIIQGKATAQARNSYKNVTQKYSGPKG